ncbi:MAG: PilZ domain-containing protein [Deltaproteobacteria bacterium]|nr:MAG: PilZ domain-containing protein [Deltaproteobacteria bacterium]
MGGTKENLDLLEQKIKFALRPLINTIKTSGMNRERKSQLDTLLLEISDLQHNLETHFEQEGSTEDKIRLTSLVDYLYSLIKGASVKVQLPERRQYPRSDIQVDVQPTDETSKAKGIRILNLSMGGMRLHSLSELKVGSVVNTKLNSSRHGIILLRGEVLWLRPKQDGEGYIVGVHFLPMDGDEEKTLTGFLEEWNT